MKFLRLEPLSGRYSPDVVTKLSNILTDLTESAGKEDLATQHSLPQAARGAQGLKPCSWGLQQCNREGARGG